MTANDPIDHALSQSPTDERFKPTDLQLDKRDGLRIPWADGHISHYPLAYLRKHCPCATCREERSKPEPQKPATSLTILPANIDRATEFVQAHLVGNYALNIAWADGHDTGIYDFRYLRTIDPTDSPDTRSAS